LSLEESKVVKDGQLVTPYVLLLRPSNNSIPIVLFLCVSLTPYRTTFFKVSWEIFDMATSVFYFKSSIV
jgi:hypothetical protein